MATHPKVLNLTLDPKLTYSTHIHNISLQATTNDKSNHSNYKSVMRPALEYASSIWLPLESSTSINKLLVIQNAALRTAT